MVIIIFVIIDSYSILKSDIFVCVEESTTTIEELLDMTSEDENKNLVLLEYHTPFLSGLETSNSLTM